MPYYGHPTIERQVKEREDLVLHCYRIIQKYAITGGWDIAIDSAIVWRQYRNMAHWTNNLMTRRSFIKYLQRLEERGIFKRQIKSFGRYGRKTMLVPQN